MIIWKVITGTFTGTFAPSVIVKFMKETAHSLYTLPDVDISIVHEQEDLEVLAMPDVIRRGSGVDYEFV